MNKLRERLKAPAVRKSIGRYQLVLDFTTAIEDEIRRREMNQSGFARLLDKSRAWVTKVFRGQPNLTFFTAYDLADALELDVKISVAPRAQQRNAGLR